MTRQKKRILLSLLLVLAALTLTACRPSTALTRLRNMVNAINLGTEEMLTQEEQEEDDTSDNEPDRQDEDNNLDEETIQTGQETNQELDEEVEQALQAIYSALAEDNEWGTAKVSNQSVEAAEDTSISSQVSGDNQNQESDHPGTQENEQDEETETPQAETTADLSEVSGETTIEPTDDSQEDQNTNQENDGGESNPESDKDVGNEEEGELVDDPTEVTGKVAATGQLAILVSMLGGEDRLCATSEDYDENEWRKVIFPDGDYEVLWSGNGSSSLSSEEDFQTLLDLAPGLIVEISGDTTFTSTQIAQLKEIGTVYEALPGFSTAEDVEYTVTRLAALLGDTSEDGGTNAPAIAESYLEWCEVIVDDLSSAGLSTKTTVFIEDWDYTAQMVYYDDFEIDSTTGVAVSSSVATVLDTGVAVIRIGTGFRPLSEYLGYANVSDYSTKPYTTNYSWTDFTSSDLSKKFPALNAAGDLCYISPIRTMGDGPVVTKMTSGIRMIYDPSSTLYYLLTLSRGNVPYLGGTENFTTVITNDSDTKEALESNMSWKWNSTTHYETGVDGGINSGTSWDISDYGTIYTTISGEYTVYVNPAGLGNWVDGSAESILETIWSAYVIQNYYTEKEVIAYIKEFYQEFYDYTLTTAQVNEILAGSTS